MIKRFIAAIILLSVNIMYGQDSLIADLMKLNSDRFPEVFAHPDKYEVQIIYTQINRDAQNRPSFVTHKYRVDPEFYYYPASSVKFPASVAALEKLNNLNIERLTKYTPLRIDSAFAGETTVEADSSSETGLPSIAHYIKKILLVSDNDAFNRIYEFTGQKYLNESLWRKGYTNLKIVHRLSIARTEEANRNTNPFVFYDSKGIVYEQPAQYNPENFNSAFRLKNTIKGKGFIAEGKLIREPMNFSNSNYISLEEHTEILKAVLFPFSTPKEKRFNLSSDDYNFLYKYMSMFPGESKYPEYPRTEYNNANVKFLMFGGKGTVPDNIRMFSKSGLAYGFLTDIAYIADFENKVEFMLSAVISVNANGIYNDDNYEYDGIGLPFLAELGKIIYNYELKRERPFLPDLSRFKFDYSK